MEPTQLATSASAYAPLIVVVDDDPDMRLLFAEILDDGGYRTHLLAEAASAVDAILRLHPRLVVLDLWLERADAGWTILGQLHRNSATRQLPIIVCSANAFMLGTMAELRAAPNYAFIAKPFDTARLLTTIASLLLRPG